MDCEFQYKNVVKKIPLNRLQDKLKCESSCRTELDIFRNAYLEDPSKENLDDLIDQQVIEAYSIKKKYIHVTLKCVVSTPEYRKHVKQMRKVQPMGYIYKKADANGIVFMPVICSDKTDPYGLNMHKMRLLENGKEVDLEHMIKEKKIKSYTIKRKYIYVEI